MNKDEIIQRRLTRVKDKKTIKVAFTPFPISSFGPMNYMFPAKGSVEKLVVSVFEMPRDGVDILVQIGLGGPLTTFKTKELFIKELFSPIGEVEIGGRLAVRVESTNPEEGIGIYWVAALWMPDRSEVSIMKFLEDSDAGETT